MIADETQTPRELEHDVRELREEQPYDIHGPDVTVEYRPPAPDERPNGIEYDIEAGTLAYDLWAAQRITLEHLRSGEYDSTAFLAGYGSGKSIFGARWLIEQALEYPGSRFLAMV